LAERQKENESLFSAYLQKIKKQTAGLSAGIRDLIWTLDPESDNLFDCAVRLQEFGESLFDGTETAFSCAGLSDRHRSVTLAPNQRKHLLLLFKEAMNNALKYAEASQCTLSVSVEQELLTISLSDDGKGFDPAAQASGYGLGNMGARAEKIGGKLIIESRPGWGTTVSLRMQMPRMG
jgi:signal transduction histidine kinase